MLLKFIIEEVKTSNLTGRVANLAYFWKVANRPNRLIMNAFQSRARRVFCDSGLIGYVHRLFTMSLPGMRYNKKKLPYANVPGKRAR